MPGLYIHIPFCAAKCRYCDFPSYAGQNHRIAPYIGALTAEMQASAGYDWGVFDTVFIGGGTPSLLSGEQMQALLQNVRRHFSLTPDAEISMECNPGTVDEKKLTAYREAGINRLSIGMQSLKDRLLKRIGRIHTKEQFLKAYAHARTAGYNNINVDIMCGLPGQSRLDYIDTLQQVISLSPEHISAYGLILEEGTALFDDVRTGSESVPDEDESGEILDAGIELLGQCGYLRYEISNFAKPGYLCRHNLNYWHNGEYLGLGAAAHSAWRLPVDGRSAWTRWSNSVDLNEYEALAPLPLEKRELSRILAKEEMFETIMLGLRMVRGVSLSAFETRFHQSLFYAYPYATEKLTKSGWLIVADGYARLTPRGLDMQNKALQYFLEEMQKAPD